MRKTWHISDNSRHKFAVLRQIRELSDHSLELSESTIPADYVAFSDPNSGFSKMQPQLIICWVVPRGSECEQTVLSVIAKKLGSILDSGLTKDGCCIVRHRDCFISIRLIITTLENWAANSEQIWRIASRLPQIAALKESANTIILIKNKPDPDQIAVRFWMAAHNATMKACRGETLEALSRLHTLRELLSRMHRCIEGQKHSFGLSAKNSAQRTSPPNMKSTFPSRYGMDTCKNAIFDIIVKFKEMLTGTYPLMDVSLGEKLLDTLGRKVTGASTPEVGDWNSQQEFIHGQIQTDHRRTIVAKIAEYCSFTSIATPELLGVAIGGSWLGSTADGLVGGFDGFSDLDIYFVCSTDDLPNHTFFSDMERSLGPSHVRQAISKRRDRFILRDPLIKLDLKVVNVDQFAYRWELPEIIWERPGVLQGILESHTVTPSAFIEPSQADAEMAMWMSTVACISQLQLGRVPAALVYLDLIREHALAPMIAWDHKQRSRGLRRFETRFPGAVAEITSTFSSYSIAECWLGLAHATRLFRSLQLHTLQSAQINIDHTNEIVEFCLRRARS
jgi:hypothetical protein